MAEVAVNLVLERLISFLNEEMQLLRDFHTEVADIKLELQFLSSFLRDADARAATEGSDEGVKTWVKHVREAAYGIGDVIDEYMLCAAKHRDQHGFKAFLKRIAGRIRSLKKEREMMSKIQDLKRSVHEIGNKRRRLDIHVSEQGGSSRGHVDPRAGLHFVESDALVGIEDSRDELIRRLNDGESMRTVISLVGMGGIGKTTLAKKVYDDVKDSFEFDCHAWITVSQSNIMVERLRTMIRRFHEAMNEHLPIGINDVTDAEELIGKSRDYLQYKRYVVVFDDVWDEQFWQVIQSALPENNNGSRVLITTRSLSVAEFCKQSCLVHVHKLQHLSLEMAQDLLCRTAFRFDQQKDCPDNLKYLSFDIARKCDGLPLAIIAIGGLLSTKGKDVYEWTRLCDDLSKQLKSNPHLAHVKTILSFSYHNLPYYLKSCFLYVGVFPRNHHIRVKKLIRLWIAEGLVKENQEMTLEETAEAYLTNLINRSLVQVEWSDSTGRVRSCRAHDLIHEVLLSKLEELSLIQSSEAGSNVGARYLWIDNNRACDLSRRSGNFQTHSIIFFNLQQLHEPIFERLSSNFELLRELDFENAPFEYLPEEIGNLWHLRHLSLRYSKVKMLPKSIGKLHNLLTLDLKGSLVVEIPDEVRGLCKLQYFRAYSVDHDNDYNINTDQGVRINGSVIGSLESLEKLYYVDFQSQNGKHFGRELGRLKRLRKLGITKLKSDCGEALCGVIKQMHHLQALRISAVKEDEVLELESMSLPPSLQRLRVHGRLVKLPGWISEVENLVKVSLHWSGISDGSIKILGDLPKLLEVWVHEGYDGVELHFEQGKFQKLKYLALRCLYKLEKVVIERGSLPCLETLGIGPSPLLQEVPINIGNLECLKNLEFHNMPKEFAQKILPSEGPDYWKVKGIPNVCLQYTCRGLYGESYKLGDFRLRQYLYQT
ncbi:RESISTANCE TO PSEUDOMONAS SYRINGAE 3, RESISTANCE TO P. SYRINGAE PV MACULICOLA 1 [Hibiscus trionum]|uniref:RESISTANCE TO PSEUDOMONAS SYRINGAE 3, RESISTANCE TO P. SYRINGAE PV MACULICOLA 1 n=1 Tax=Hibiscus trionum TaxID=183268 RepID=A0A9W7HKM5_HIBTR|nr:RESISTANCE TO PSEUDOMONAS SYRINGAE 3, RESISTANCE TO P. SYRINGAE PV MACULICOLA 1 [Hibiscus trionum]